MASLKKWLDRRRHPWRGLHYDAFKRWKREGGPARLYAYTDLPEGAVVFDMGGYKGEWAEMVLAAQPRCTVHVFEPHPRFAEALAEKFASDARVHVHALALGAAEGEMQLSDSADASSAVANLPGAYRARIQSVTDFFATHDIPRIDLMKVNIEGGEYDLLPALIDAGIMARITRLQVQFHLFAEHFIAERDTIRTALSDSHECLWDYPFVWEEWRQKA